MTDVFLVLNGPGTVDAKGSMKNSVATTVITPSGGTGENTFYGFNLTYVSSTVVNVGTGSASLVNGSAFYKITSNTVLPINWAVLGAGGLDTGTPVIAWYYAWIIVNPTTNAISTLFSLSATAPVMPAGYTLKRRIGSIHMSGNRGIPFMQIFVQSGSGPTKTYTSPDACLLIDFAAPPGFTFVPTSVSDICPLATSISATTKLNTTDVTDTCVIGPYNGSIGVIEATITGPARIAKLTVSCLNGSIGVGIFAIGVATLTMIGTGWTEDL